MMTDERKIQIAHIITASDSKDIHILNMCNCKSFRYGSDQYFSNIFIKNPDNTLAGLNASSLIVRRVPRMIGERLLSHCLGKSWNNVPK